MESFVPVPPGSDFPLENLPYGVFTSPSNATRHIGVAIGKSVLDLYEAAHLFTGPLLRDKQHVFKEQTLNAFMGLTPEHWSEARSTLQGLLGAGGEGRGLHALRDDPELRGRALLAQAAARMHLPAAIGDYTDFYSSIHHATNVGRMFRSEENALMPNWRHIPVGYHGRSSSVVVSGTPIHRPYGQTQPVEGGEPAFGPSKLMDFELEVGCFVGGAETRLGERVSAADAGRHLFGFVLVNDWSARDIQKWEYVPLGPFTAKNLGTSISPWVVTVQALQPFLVPNYPQQPQPFPYLRHRDPFNFDIQLEVELTPGGAGATEEEAGTGTGTGTGTTVCRSNYRHLYWTAKQQLAQQTVTGCNVRPGDLLASGTISGDSDESLGSMLELSWRGSRPVALRGGETRRFLQDGDTVTLRGRCRRAAGAAGEAGAPAVELGFGVCSGRLLPAIPFEH